MKLGAVIRGNILYYLYLIYPRSISLTRLQGDLDSQGCPVPMCELDFHAAYLAEKGFVHTSANLVSITAKGIDYYDRLLPRELGIDIGDV